MDQHVDRQDITDLTIAYAWALDTRRFDDLRDVFTPDATALLTRELSGADAIIGLVSRLLSPMDATQHIVANHQVRISGDTATCRCYLQAQHVRRGMDGGENYVVGGRYEDDLVRTDAGWRIARRVLVPLWSEGNIDVVRVPRPRTDAAG